MNSTSFLIQKRNKQIAYLLLLSVVVVWGATFPLVKAALQYCSPLFFNQLRMMLAACILAVVHLRQWKQLSFKTLCAGAVSGVLLAAGYELQTAGLASTTPSKSAFLTGAIVIFVPLLCLIPGLRPPTMHRVGFRQLPGVLLAFCGILLLTVPPTTPLHAIVSSLQRGDLLSLLCAVAFALHLISLAHFSMRHSIAQLSMLQIVCCALTMMAFTPWVEHIHYRATPMVWVTLSICALFATAAAFTIQSWSQQFLPATHTALLLSLEPVFAWVTSILFYKERLSWRSSIGSVLIFVGILAVEFVTPVPADANAQPISEDSGPIHKS